jgi:hypothetical protein
MRFLATLMAAVALAGCSNKETSSSAISGKGGAEVSVPLGGAPPVRPSADKKASVEGAVDHQPEQREKNIHIPSSCGHKKNSQMYPAQNIESDASNVMVRDTPEDMIISSRQKEDEGHRQPHKMKQESSTLPASTLVSTEESTVQEEEECAVCYLPMEQQDETLRLSCGHLFHTHCILRAFQMQNKLTCQTCRTPQNGLEVCEPVETARGVGVSYVNPSKGLIVAIYCSQTHNLAGPVEPWRDPYVLCPARQDSLKLEIEAEIDKRCPPV